jgi:hypothetical protein
VSLGGSMDNFWFFKKINWVVREVYYSIDSDLLLFDKALNNPEIYHEYSIYFDIMISGILKEPLESLFTDIVDREVHMEEFSNLKRLEVTSRILDVL